MRKTTSAPGRSRANHVGTSFGKGTQSESRSSRAAFGNDNETSKLSDGTTRTAFDGGPAGAMGIQCEN